MGNVLPGRCLPDAKKSDKKNNSAPRSGLIGVDAESPPNSSSSGQQLSFIAARNKPSATPAFTPGKHSNVLSVLREIPGNDICADCSSRDPKWASVSLGILICIKCSEVHQQLGSTASRVRSTIFDEWDSEQMAVMVAMGNEKSNRVWEATLSPNDKVTEVSSWTARKLFIQRKYLQKLYCAVDKDKESAHAVGNSGPSLPT